MKYDTIIIGGGLAGLTCGIKLAEGGQRPLLVTVGQSSLHFASGSIDLMGYDAAGAAIDHPFEQIEQASAPHPYSKVAQPKTLAEEARALLAGAGLDFTGEAEANHGRLTPVGTIKPTWLTLSPLATTEGFQPAACNHVAIVNIAGFLDLPTDFMRHEIEKSAQRVSYHEISTSGLKRARMSPSEMRATNLAKILQSKEEVEALADQLKKLSIQADKILIPTVLNPTNQWALDLLRQAAGCPLSLIPTMPPSVAGVTIHNSLRQRFCALGGEYLNNDRAMGGNIGSHVEGITTEKLEGTTLEADNYVLTTGSFMSGGLKSNYDCVSEPVFGLDTNASAQRGDWTTVDFFETQPYMTYGVITDERLRVSKGGTTVDNLYAAGTVLAGNDPVAQANKEGVEMLTALQVAHNILSK